MRRIVNFFRFTFLGRADKAELTNSFQEVEIIDEVAHQEADIPISQPGEGRSDDKTRNHIVVQINRILGTICLGSFGFIIVYAFIRPDKTVPDIIQSTFSVTIGYFGSALVTFLERRPSKT